MRAVIQRVERASVSVEGEIRGQIGAGFLVLIGVEEGDGDADYGFGKVYMPQAVSTGGLNNSYAVPSGGGDYTYNFRVENGTVRIILGVIRSGKLSDKKGYTVDVYTSAEDTAAAVSAFGGEAMPEGLYSLPSTVVVPDGKTGGTFYLDIPVLAISRSEYAGKKLVLSVGIRNPSAYELSDAATKTAVIVNVDALKALL